MLSLCMLASFACSKRDNDANPVNSFGTSLSVASALEVTAFSKTSASLKWKIERTDENAPAGEVVIIEQRADSSAWLAVDSVSSQNISKTIERMYVLGIQYSFRVKVKAGDRSGEYSNVVSSLVPATLSVISVLAVSAVSDASVTLTWNIDRTEAIAPSGEIGAV